MTPLPVLAIRPVPGGFVSTFKKAILVLRDAEKTGLHNAYTIGESGSMLPGKCLLPGVIYNTDYIPLSTASRFAVSCLEKKIPSQYDAFSRYLDLGNGAVLRWNCGFEDDYGQTTFDERDGEWIATYTMNEQEVTMKLEDDDMNIRLIRENTGIAIIDDVNVLRMILVFMTCAAWASGKLYYATKGLLGYCYSKSGYGEFLCRVQHGWTSQCSHVTSCMNDAGDYVFENVKSFAGFVGLSKVLDKAPGLVLPKKMLRVVKHRCYSAVPRLACFENLGGFFCGPALDPATLKILEDGLNSLLSTGDLGAALEGLQFLVTGTYVEPDYSRLKFLE